MADPTIVREWLEKADEDFRFAEANLLGGSAFYPQICFHFHQAAEKYLKAFIVARELVFSKVHDLLHLLRICAAQAPAFREIEEPTASCSIPPTSKLAILSIGRPITTGGRQSRPSLRQVGLPGWFAVSLKFEGW